MSALPQSISTREPLPVHAEGKTDLTGRSRLVSNVLFSWGAQMVFMVAGFVMPRMIDQKLGQELLGIWDFSWSLVTYFRLVDLGLTSSISRHVANYWGAQDHEGISRVVSSASLVLSVAAVIVVMATVTSMFLLPQFFGNQIKEHLHVSQMSVLCLGLMAAIGMGLGAYNGVLTGCHRWELQSMRLTVWHALTVGGMVVAVSIGGGLIALAVITAIGNILGQMTTVVLAYRICPGLRVKFSYVEWKTIKQLYVYSSKTLLPIASEILLAQTTNLLVAGSLGLSALALFSRPRSLLRQLESLQGKMALILLTTTSSLQSQQDLKEVRALLFSSVRYSLFLALPVAIFLIIFGKETLHLWMGSRYSNGALPAILAVGFLGASIDAPITSVLLGLNAHGKACLVYAIISFASILAMFGLVAYFQAGLITIALVITLPLFLMRTLFLPYVVCQHLNIQLGRFCHRAIVQPILTIIPFLASLIGARLLLPEYPKVAVAAFSAGVVLTVAVYWRHVLPERLKSRIMAAVPRYRKLLRRDRGRMSEEQ